MNKQHTARLIGGQPRSLSILLFSLFFVVGIFYTIAVSIGDSLFLSNIPQHQLPQMLPLVYLGIAVLNTVLALSFMVVLKRFSRRVVIPASQVLLMLTLVGGRFLVDLHLDWVYFLLAVWLEVCSIFSVTLVFSFAGDFYSPRQARKMYTFLAGGLPVGAIVAAGLMHILLRTFEIRDILFLIAGLQGLCVLLTLQYTQHVERL